MAGVEDQVRAIFLTALERAPDQWTAFLDQACGGDPDVRARVGQLLNAHREMGSIHAGDPGPAVTTTPPPANDSPATVIGPYKLLEQIGEGGFGVVYLAEQAAPVRRRVALKVLKPGMDTRQVVARFEAERQALALMDHPNIARVLDGGATPTGRPYFAMELVKGVPVTDYCDQNRLPLRDRLTLFVQVCEAVQHAHQKGVIHRDLKPSNVLVSRHDTTPVVKVIDFGVAKALGQELTDKTLFTGVAQMIGTPLYMSPEQAGMSDLDVDTRSDIYSLGVLLYELLTGSTPFAKERFRQAAYDEIRRIIREEEPPSPSSRISTLGQAATTVSANRSLEPVRLSRLVRGELDWIVMRALEKDRNRRYESAAALAADVRRYLADEPVQAGPASAGYRVRKFARRHRRGLIAAGAFLLLLVTAVVALSVALLAVDRERRQKETALKAEGKRRQQARDALDAMSSAVIEGWLVKQPALLPEHRRFLEQALRSYEEFAADTGEQEESRAGAARAYQRVGVIQNRLGQRTEAEAAWQSGLRLYAGLVADFPANPEYQTGLAATHQHLGYSFKETGRLPEAEAAFAEAVAVCRRLVAADPGRPESRLDLARVLHTTATLLDDTGHLEEAQKVYRECMALYRQLVADFPTVADYRLSLAKYLNSQGIAFKKAGRLPEAEAAYRESVALTGQLAADFPTVTDYREGQAMTLNNLGILLKDTGRAAEGEELYRQALAVHKQLAADHPTISDYQNNVAGAMTNLARLLLARKEAAARQLLEEALAHHQAALKANPRHPSYRQFYRFNRWRMSETLLALNDHAGAASAADQFLQTATDPPRDAYTAAGLLAGCARLAAQDDRLGERERQDAAAAYGDKAVAALRQAVEKGAKEVAQMATDPSLNPLRSRPDFQKVLADWGATRKK